MSYSQQDFDETVDILLTVLLQSREQAIVLFSKGLIPEHIPTHRLLLERLQKAVFDENNSYDILILIDGLEYKQKYLHLFTNEYITTLNVMFFLKQIILNYDLINMNTVLTHAAIDCGKIDFRDPPENLDMLKSKLQRQLDEFNLNVVRNSAPATIHDINDHLIYSYNNPEKFTKPYPAGFRGMDLKTRGIRLGEMVGIAAPSMGGKTTFALNIASHLISKGLKCIVFNNEQTVEALAQIFYCIHAKLPFKALTERRLSGEQYGRYVESMKFISDNNMITFNDRCRGKWEPTHSEILRFTQSDEQNKVVILDYIQQQSVITQRFRSKKEEIDFVSKELKDLTQDKKLITLCLAQLNREALNPANPNTEDPEYLGRSCIKDTNNIYQDCDTIYTIKNQEVLKKVSKSNKNGFDVEVESMEKIPYLGLAKCRHDFSPCRLRLDFDSSTKTFREYEG